MVVGGPLSLVQKGQTSGCSGHRMQWNSGIWWWGHCLWCKKVKPVDAVDTGRSGIVVYGGGDIVFGAKRSNQWMQWTQYVVEYWYMVVGTLALVQKGQTMGCSGCSVQWNSGMLWWGHCSLVQKGQTSGRSMQWTQWNSVIWWWGHCLWCKKVKPVDAVDAVTQWTQWMQYAVDTVDVVE